MLITITNKGCKRRVYSNAKVSKIPIIVLKYSKIFMKFLHFTIYE